MSGLKTKLSKFKANTKGHIAVSTALIGLPLLMIAGYAVDYNAALRGKTDIKAAIDTAALAAVLPSSLSEDERKAYAQDVFDSNYFGAASVELTIDASPTKVSIDGVGKSPSLLGGIVGKDTMSVRDQAVAVKTVSDVVCVLALDPHGERSIEFLDSAEFSAPACSVQANSTHNLAINTETVFPPTARSVCATGATRGRFNSVVKHGCTPIEDPYKDLVVPKAADSCDQVKQVYIRGNNSSAANLAVLESDLQKTADGESVIPSGSVLYPGIYCDGLVIDGADVTLMPGVYGIWGDLEFTSFAAVAGDGVTFLLKGESNRLLIEDGAELSLRAPKDGPTAGLVFWQRYLQFWPYVFGKVPEVPDATLATSEINNGGGLKIIGTAYLPNHELIIKSDNSVASQSPATSFIARRIKFAGKTKMTVNVDHEKGGVPPIEPRSDEGARLLK